jgi:hypothetical protein
MCNHKIDGCNGCGRASSSATFDQAEGEIRGYGQSIVHGIVAIGKKLVEIKTRLKHGGYENFVRDRLRFSTDSALRFVQCYQWYSKTATLRDLETIQIDVEAAIKKFTAPLGLSAPTPLPAAISRGAAKATRYRPQSVPASIVAVGCTV